MEDFLRAKPPEDEPLPASDGSAAWQPIETAPKNGTRLLLWRPDEMEIGYWSTSLWVIRPEGSSFGKQDGAWIIYENRSDTIELSPTHWMPLPKPPNAEVSDRRPAASESSETHNGGSLH